MKLLIVSICKNEAATIAELHRRMPKKIKGVKKIITCLIDDGSTDGTSEVAKKSGFDKVIRDGNSRGLAYRFREAVNIALDEKADIMVNIDGDLQFNPEDIPSLVAPVTAGEVDFVAADRFTDPSTGKLRKPMNMPPVKYYGNKLGARIVSGLSRQRFNDVTCGFRAYNQNALVALNITGQHTYTQESFQVLAAKRLRIKTIPTEVKYFKGRKSRVVTSIPGFITRSALNIIRSYRDFAPLRFFLTLGSVPFVIGLAMVGFVLWHWLSAGQITPYKAIGFTGIYLISLGFFFCIIALLADMLVRVLNNQEKIIEHQRREKLDK